MIVDINEYVLSLIKVLVCCLIRDFAIPLFVWRIYLKNKTYSYRFWFCIITQAALLINLVLFLGFLNICNRWTIFGGMILIYSLIAWNFSDKKIFKRCRKYATSIWEANKEDRLLKYLGQKIVEGLQVILRTVFQRSVFRVVQNHWLEVVGLITVECYNIWFLTRNLMLYHCYQFSDLPVHQSWIYGLEHGTLFVDGVYPFGMHAMIFIIRIMFGLNLRDILLYAGAYQTIILVVGLYLLAKQIFHARYTPLAVILIFSLMLNQGRYAASLPQEAGMYAAIGVAYFMLRFLHTGRKKFVIEEDSKLKRIFRCNSYINRRYLNSDALLMMLSVALVISYHFYTAIAAVFLVIAIGLSYLPRILKKQYFIPLLFCGFMGAAIAILPFVACLAKGIPFQGSMAWATSVISGEKWQGEDTKYLSQLAEEKGLGNLRQTTTAFDNNAIKEKEKSKVDYLNMTLREILQYYYKSISYFSEKGLFNKEISRWMFLSMLIGFLLSLSLLFSKKARIYGHAYHAIILYMTILVTLGAAKKLGIVELMESSRISTFAEPMIGFIFMIPVDIGLRILSLWKNRYYQFFLRLLSAAICVGAVVLIMAAGWYHTYFNINQTYYNEAEYVLRHIKQSYDKHTYTIVSPTEEYYDTLDYGYHMELTEFLNMVDGKQKEFTFPTKFVFIFVEKRVLSDYFYGSVKVGLKYAAMDFVYKANSQDYFYQRAIIESQAYYWAQKFKSMYPRNFKVYFEDNVYVVYLMEQNTYSPYSLRINYLADYADEIVANGWNRSNNSN